MSAFGEWYGRVYDALCGRHPRLRPWHFQWLGAKDLYRALRRELPRVRGALLDVGCGGKPYAAWVGPDVKEHFGIDVKAAPGVDAVLDPGKPWPVETSRFDAILCTQVLEHVRELDLVVDELARALRPGGRLILTVPFAYNEHGTPHDYRRLSVHGARELLAPRFEILDVRAHGGIGSTLGTLALNWMDLTLNRWKPTRFARAPLVPLWIALSALVNALGALFDALDRTERFYSNVFVVAEKPLRPREAR